MCNITENCTTRKHLIKPKSCGIIEMFMKISKLSPKTAKFWDTYMVVQNSIFVKRGKRKCQKDTKRIEI